MVMIRASGGEWRGLHGGTVPYIEGDILGMVPITVWVIFRGGLLAVGSVLLVDRRHVGRRVGTGRRKRLVSSDNPVQT